MAKKKAPKTLEERVADIGAWADEHGIHAVLPYFGSFDFDIRLKQGAIRHGVNGSRPPRPSDEWWIVSMEHVITYVDAYKPAK